MRIAVLGPLEVLTDQLAPIAVPGAKERLLLAVLTAGAPGVVSTDRLAEALWNGEPPVSARKSLQAHVVRLRSSLEPGRPRGSSGQYVVRRGQGYALTVGRGDIDALRIGDLASRGRAQLAAGDPVEAARLLASAVELWRGEPYGDWPEAEFAETERLRLAELRSGALAGLLEARLQLGRHADALPELEALVARDPLREDWWRLLMLALYRAGRQADALAAGRRVRALLAEELGTEPGPALRKTEAAILAQDPALESEPRASAPPPVSAGACPYKGLAAYQVDDAPLFHGRRRLVAALVARLVDASVVVVSGPSGAGKSSVVRAGLVPALIRGGLPGSEAWRPVIVTPGRNPVDVLADLTGESPPTASVLLVCDQFEELWAPDVDPVERTAFLDAVLGLLADGIVVRCVAVLRGDHVGRLAEHAAFTDALGGTLVLVPALTDDELREIVREPARAVGLTVEPALLDAVLADVLGRPGALPLLSTALVGTWERRRGDLLTLGGYLEAGGVAGALTRSAESTYARLDLPAQERARRVFVRLADVDDGGTLVRRRVPLAELALDDGQQAGTRAVVEAFVRRRLLAVDGDRLEVTHEALLTGWPRLARWLEDDAVGRSVRRHLGPAARMWAEVGRPADELYRGARLVGALDWADGDDADVTPLEQEFLDASRAQTEAELTEARQRAYREANGRRRTRRLAVGLAVVLVVALVAAGVAVLAQREARQASLVADANRLAALSTTASTLDTSLLLAVQALGLADTPETRDALVSALVDRGRAVRAVPFTGRSVGAFVGNDGRTLYIGAADENFAWEVGSASLPRAYYAYYDWWTVAAASPTDDLTMGAGVGDDGHPWLRLVSGDGTETTLLEREGVGGVPVAGSFSADGRRVLLVVAAPDDEEPTQSSRWRVISVDPDRPSANDTGITGTLAVPLTQMAGVVSDDAGSVVLTGFAPGAPAVRVDLSGGREVGLAVPGRDADSVGLLALPSGAAHLWADGAVTLYGRDGAVRQTLDAHQAPVRDVAVSPDGTWAVTAGDGALVVLWDVDASTGLWSQREILTGHRGDVITADVDPRGRQLFTTSLDDTVIAWDMSDEAGFGDTYARTGNRWIANRPEEIEPGVLVAPTRAASSARVDPSSPPADTAGVAATFIDSRTGEQLAEMELGDTVADDMFGSSVAVSPDGSMVAVTWGMGATVLDTRTHEVVSQVTLPTEGQMSPGLPAPAWPVWSAAWSRDGTRLLLGMAGDSDGHNGDIAVVDPLTGRLVDVVQVPMTAQVMEPSPDGEHIVVAGRVGGSIHVLDADDLGIEATVGLGTPDFVVTLDFSPDGRLLVAGGKFGLLHLIDTGSWEPVRSPTSVHEDSVLQVEWLDARTVVSSGIDATVRLFDTERGLVRGRPLRASTDPDAGSTWFVPGPVDEIVALSGDRPGRRYQLDPAKWIDEACAVVGRDLSRVEWDRFLSEQPYEATCTGA